MEEITLIVGFVAGLVTIAEKLPASKLTIKITIEKK